MTAPVYLTAPVWAPDYVRRFAEVCIASLLAPGNLPALGRPCVMLCATRQEDWPEILAHPLVQRAQALAEFRPVFLESLPDETGTMMMARGQLAMFQLAQAAGALTIVFCADRVWADGDLVRLVKLAAPGRRMVMAPGFRITEEEVNPLLGVGQGEVVVSNRGLAAMCVNNMHDQYRTWNADAPICGNDGLAGPWWRASPDGAVVHSLNWEPVLIDFGHPWPHDVDPLRRWSIDGHYAWWNCTRPEHWYAVTDSDEYIFASPTPTWGVAPAAVDVGAAEAFRSVRRTPGIDPLRQALAEIPYLMHGSAVDDGWAPTRERAAAMIAASHVEPPERWQVKQEFISLRHVASGPHRDVALVHGHAYSVTKGPEPLRSRIFRDDAQPHTSIEDALAACGVQK